VSVRGALSATVTFYSATCNLNVITFAKAGETDQHPLELELANINNPVNRLTKDKMILLVRIACTQFMTGGLLLRYRTQRGLCVCVLRTWMSCTKTVKLIEMQLRMTSMGRGTVR